MVTPVWEHKHLTWKVCARYENPAAKLPLDVVELGAHALPAWGASIQHWHQ